MVKVIACVVWLVGVVACTAETVNTPAAAPAASGTLTVDEVSARYGPAVCARSKECDAAGFAKDYPTDAACRDDFATRTRQASGGNGAAVSKCSNAAVDVCVVDVQKLSCADLAAGKLPASCSC